jgi:hypothetical protein
VRLDKRLTRSCNLSDHCVEGETDKTTDGYTISTGLGVEDLGRYYPSQRTASHRKGELKNPTKDKEQKA